MRSDELDHFDFDKHYENLQVSEGARPEVIKAAAAALRCILAEGVDLETIDQHPNALALRVVDSSEELLLDAQRRKKFDEVLKEKRVRERRHRERVRRGMLLDTALQNETAIQDAMYELLFTAPKDPQSLDAWMDGRRSFVQGFKASDCPWNASEYPEQSYDWLQGFSAEETWKRWQSKRSWHQMKILALVIGLPLLLLICWISQALWR